ncbi:MAG: cyclic nucleotide-binding domain-containing protein [Spirochaetia bacterium]
MESLKRIDDTVTELPRGGYLLNTSVGYIQFGAPPETIKDTMKLPSSVPEIFVLPDKFFNWKKGISIAELEFPIYFNFFIRKKKTRIICTRSQAKRLVLTLQEAVFGPKTLQIEENFDTAFWKGDFPDLRKELAYFRNGIDFEDVLEFIFFKDNQFSLNGVRITRTDYGVFEVFEDGKKIATVPERIYYNPRFKIGQRLPDPFTPPLYGVTCLGPSHGFDPTENTSGYVVWLNHNGIMIDPPVDSSLWLERSNVNPKVIDSIILTHCHADHDAGTFQKIIEEGRVTIYSTKTIMHSFLRKYSAITNEPIDYLEQLFDFHPIYIGKPLFIHGAKFKMFFTLHSIPTIGFTMDFQDQTFVYSSDHQGDPEIHNQLLEKNVIDKQRYEELSNFPWDRDVIYHESGIPPLHTPIKYLNSMPESIQNKTVVYHIAKKDFPEKTDLKLATFGIENTLYFKVSPPDFEKSYQILSLLRHVDFVESFSVEKVQQFISFVHEERYKKGEFIIRKGSKGDKFFMIFSGNVAIVDEKGTARKIYGKYEYFGEVAALSEKTRSADVVAANDVVLFSMQRDQFLNFISGTDFEKNLRRLAANRSFESWNVFTTSEFFQQLTTYQITWLESLIRPVEIALPGALLKEGTKPERIYIIREGIVHVDKGGKHIADLKRGDFVGMMRDIYRQEPSGYTFTIDKEASLYSIEEEDVIEFLSKNPGLIMKLVYDFD